MNARHLLSVALIASLAACGGGGGSSPSAIPAKPQGTGSLTITFKVPTKTAQLRPHRKGSLQPMYESPATQGVGISIAASQSALPAPQSPTFAFDLSTCTPTNNCTQNTDGSRSYTLQSGIEPVGSYFMAMETWDVAPTSGAFPTGTTHELSDGIAPVTISAINTSVNISLNGIPATVTAVPMPNQTHVRVDTSGSGYDIIGNVPTQWLVTALDNDGYLITGDGEPHFSFTTNGVYTVAPAVATGQYTVTTILAKSIPEPITITAQGLGPSNVTSNQGSVAITPLQELWVTANGDAGGPIGIYGFQLVPDPQAPGTSSPSGPVFGPPMQCCPEHETYIDFISTDDQYAAIAQDASGVLWVYDSTANTIQSFTISNTTNALTPGIAISTAGKNIQALACDGNGFLYAIDAIAGALDVWQVVTATPGTTPTFTTTIASAEPEGISVVPQNGLYPSGVAGDVVVADANGFDAYTNASSGAPTFIGNVLGTSNGYSPGFASDSATMWALTNTTEPTLTGYTVGSGFSLAQQGQLVLAHANNGALAAGLSQYAYVSSGLTGASQVDVFNLFDGAITADDTYNGGSGNYSIGPAECCQGFNNYEGVVISP